MIEHLLDEIDDLEISISDLFDKIKKDKAKIKRINNRIRDKKEKLSLLDLNSKEYIKLSKSIENDRIKVKNINKEIRLNNRKINEYDEKLDRANFLNTIDFI